MDTEKQIELKKKFAEALLREPDDPFKAAFSVIPDTGLAMQAANLWVRDDIVLAEQVRLMDENGPRAYLPTKEQQAKDIYKLAQSNNVDEETRLKAHRLYAEIMGHIEKPVAGNTTNVLNQGVMMVVDHGSDADWEQKAIEQQRRLTINGNASVN